MSAVRTNTQDNFDSMSGQVFKGYRRHDSPVGGDVAFNPVPAP